MSHLARAQLPFWRAAAASGVGLSGRQPWFCPMSGRLRVRLVGAAPAGGSAGKHGSNGGAWSSAMGSLKTKGAGQLCSPGLSAPAVGLSARQPHPSHSRAVTPGPCLRAAAALGWDEGT